MIGTVRVASGGEGEATAIAGEVITIVIERAYAPGAPIQIELSFEGGAITLRAKTVGSRRQPDGRFEVRARMLDLRREDRARLGVS